MNYDKLYGVAWKDIRQNAMTYVTMLDKIKHKRPEQVLMGLAILTILACRRFKVDPRRLLETAERVLRFAEDTLPQYPRAISEWFEKEL